MNAPRFPVRPFRPRLPLFAVPVLLGFLLPACQPAEPPDDRGWVAPLEPTLSRPTLGQYAISDPVLQMTAWSFVAPVDWERSGGTYWTGRLLPLAYYSELTVRNPAGSEAVQLFPTEIYVDTASPLLAAGRPMSPYPAADQCIRQMLLPKYRGRARGLKVVATEREPAQLVAEAKARARTQGVAACDVRAARVLVEYEEDGRTLREMVFATLVAPPTQGPVVWCIERALGLRAEKGEFDRSYRLLGLVASSLRENQAWVQARGRRLRAMVPPPTPRSGGGPSILDVSRSISRNNDQFLRDIDAVHTQRLNTPAGDGWTRAFRNTDLRVNPSTGEEIEVTGGYLQYYQDYSGRIYGSNDPGDFYLQTKIGGTVLQPAP